MLFAPAFIEVLIRNGNGRRAYLRVSNINEVFEQKESGKALISFNDGSFDLATDETFDAIRDKIQKALNPNAYLWQPSNRGDWMNRKDGEPLWYTSVGEDGKPQNNVGGEECR